MPVWCGLGSSPGTVAVMGRRWVLVVVSVGSVLVAGCSDGSRSASVPVAPAVAAVDVAVTGFDPVACTFDGVPLYGRVRVHSASDVGYPSGDGHEVTGGRVACTWAASARNRSVFMR